MADVQEEGGHETVDLIKGVGGQAIFVKTDVTKSADVQAMVSAAVDNFGGLDCAHNNAGIAVGGHPLAETPEEDWYRAVDVMLNGVFLGMKYEIHPCWLAGPGRS